MEPEPSNAQDARVEKLWQTLDTRKEGYLDFNGLRKGLKRMDHRMCWTMWCENWVLISGSALKNADGLLRDVLKAVDTSGDGRIQYNGMILELLCYYESCVETRSSY